MKKLNILLLSALALGVTTISCTKDDAKPSIVAKWTFDTYTLTKSGTPSASAPVNDPTCTDKNYLDLRTGGVVEQQVIGTTDDPCGATKIDGTYTFQNNNIQISANNSTVDYAVVSITSTKLIIKIPASSTDSTQYYTVTCIK